MTGGPYWPEDAIYIREWASGGTVSTDRLLAELHLWVDHFGTLEGVDRDDVSVRGSGRD